MPSILTPTLGSDPARCRERKRQAHPAGRRLGRSAVSPGAGGTVVGGKHRPDRAPSNPLEVRVAVPHKRGVVSGDRERQSALRCTRVRERAEDHPAKLRACRCASNMPKKNHQKKPVPPGSARSARGEHTDAKTWGVHTHTRRVRGGTEMRNPRETARNPRENREMGEMGAIELKSRNVQTDSAAHIARRRCRTPTSRRTRCTKTGTRRVPAPTAAPQHTGSGSEMKSRLTARSRPTTTG